MLMSAHRIAVLLIEDNPIHARLFESLLEEVESPTFELETAERLSGAHPKRQCGIVLEASRLRPGFRELDPVEVYGSALTAVFHGAKELAWWHFSHITGSSGTALDHEKTYALVKSTYQLLEEVDPWLEDLTPVKRVALLHSRASEDWWRFYSSGEPNPCLTHEGKDARYASRAQVEVLMHCLRNFVPVDLYYLDAVTADQLADYPIIVVPFPFAISDDQAKLLERIAGSGKSVVVISEVGTLAQDGRIRERPALLDLLGLVSAPTGEQAGTVMAAGVVAAGLQAEVATYGKVEPAQGTECWATVNDVPAIISRPVGEGRVVFLAGEFGVGLPENYDNEIRTREERIYPPRLAEGRSQLLSLLYARLTGSQPSVASKLDVKYPGETPQFPDDPEIATATNARGDLVYLCTNWTGGTASFALATDEATYNVAAATAKLIGPDARVVDVEGVPGELRAQEACVIRVPRRPDRTPQ